MMAYKWERTIILSGMAAEGLYPTRGIAAGDFAATYLLKAYLVQIARRQQAEHSVWVNIHVDDISQEIGAPTSRQVVMALGRAARRMKRAFEDELHMELSSDKGGLVYGQ